MRVLIMAAGRGTRMKSSLPKMLHTLAGYPIIDHIIHTLIQLHPSHLGIVVRPGQDALKAHIQTHWCHLDFSFFEQEEALGTGHAVQCAKDFYQEDGRTLIVCGDTPLMKHETLQELCALRTPLALIAMHADPLRGYGRCQIDNQDQARVVSIVESQDALVCLQSSPEDTLYNAGVYVVDNALLRHCLPLLRPSSVTQEFYLTDLVHLAYQDQKFCGWIKAEEEQFLGVNCRADLADAERFIQKRLRRYAMDQGCTLIDPDTVYLSRDTQIAEDVWIGPSVFLGPKVKIEQGARITGFCVIHDAVIGAHTHIGPFVHLRPGTILKDHVKIGNFVEVKNTTMHEHAKANHLSYLGDAFVGARTNIGAGTITCNYDGMTKHVTQIDQDVMIGSNTALVAPLHIGSGAYIGAGSVITQNVPAQDLAIARGIQRNIAQGAQSLKARKKVTTHTP